MTVSLPPALHGAILVSGNPGKAAEARRIVGASLETHALDLPEIQSLDLLEVLRAKAAEAWKHLQRPLIVDETGLELGAFGGFPGPLVKWMLEAMGAAGMANAALRLEEPSVVARCALLYFDGEDATVGEGVVQGTIVAPRGQGGFGWDSIFLPAGETQTYAELSSEHKDRIGHRGLAWKAMVREMNRKSKSRKPEAGT